ncbi:MAG: hypothetical protein LC792_06445 [Actinobacteria bacterium]|nr:hypothetical protein [Actinomycetota bacterium]
MPLRRVFARALFPMILLSAIAGMHPALADTPTTYSGRAVALAGSAVGVDLPIADTGQLDSTGGERDAKQVSESVPGLAAADSLSAWVMGVGDTTSAAASSAALSLTAGGNTIGADFVMTTATAATAGTAPSLSGSAEVEGLVVNGQPVAVTGAPNQTVPLAGGSLVINEQTSSTSGSTGAITVRGLHVNAAGVNLVASSSTAGITVGTTSPGTCSPSDARTTGGGYLGSGAAKQSFGFIAGLKNGVVFGHTEFVDHATGQQVDGVVDTYTPSFVGGADWTGHGTVNGQPVTFTASATDFAEPGKDQDNFTIQASNGATASGVIQAGNIQQHKGC